jgi:hypothetical protein
MVGGELLKLEKLRSRFLDQKLMLGKMSPFSGGKIHEKY